jgi:PAS domain S-box-containing protein
MTPDLQERITQLHSQVEALEASLRETETRYRSLFEYAPQGIYRSTPDGRFLSVNPAMAMILGYDSPDELLATIHNIRQQIYVHPHEREEILNEIDRSGPTRRFEVEAYRKDGSTVWVSINSRMVFDETGAVQYYEGFAEDITTRKRAEQAREESLSLLRATLEATADGLLVVTRQGKVLTYNQKFVSMWGVPASMLTPDSNPAERFQFLAAQTTDPDKFKARVLEIFDSSPEAEVFDLIEMRDGRIFERCSQPQRLNGQIVGRVWSYRDITARQQTEEALRLSEAKFRNIFENSLVGIGRCRAEDGRFLTANHRCAEILGVASPADLIEQHVVTDFHVNLGDRQRMIAELYKQGQIHNFEIQLRRQTGELIWGLISLRLNLKEGCTDFVIADITDRKQAETQLRQQQDVLRTVIDTDPNIIFVKDWDGRYLLANKAAAELYDATVDEILGKRDIDLHAQPEVTEQFVQENRWVIETGQELFIPEEQVTAGRHLGEWLQWQKRPIQLPGSDRYCVLGIGVRITDRKRAEIALRESQERYATLARVSPVGIFRTDPVGNCQYFNERGCSIIGLRLEETLGKAWIRALHPDDREMVLSEWSRTLETDAPFIAEYRFLRPDGETVWVLGQAVSETDATGRIVGYVGTITDITDRKLAEEALQDSEAEYRVLVETANCIILRWDTDGYIRFINDYGQQFFGYALSDLVGHHLLGTIVPQTADFEHHINTLMEGLRLDPDRYSFVEQQNMRCNGVQVWIAWSNKPIWDEHGNLIEILSVGTDATDRKQAETALRRSELKFRNIFENSQVGIYRTRIDDGLIIEANQRYVELTGYDSGDDLVGKRYTREFFVDLGDRQRMLDLLNQHGTINDFEMLFLQKGGAIRWGMYSLRLNQEENCIEGVVADITDRKRAEESLRFYKQALDSSSDAIGLADAQGNHFYQNRAFSELYECNSVEVFNANGGIPAVYDDPAIAADVLSTTLNGDSWLGEVEHHTRSGRRVQVLLRSNPILGANGNVVGVIGAHTDITDRKRAEEALRLSELKFRNIFENSQIGICRTRPSDGLILEANHRLAEIMGYSSAAELIGKRRVTEFYINPEERQRVIGAVREQGEVRDREVQLFRRDGTIIWGLLSVRPNLEENCYEGVIADISDRKRLEETLRQSQQFLDSIVENLPLALFTKDITNNFRYVQLNKNGERLLGFSRAEAIGHTDYDLISETEANRHRNEDLAAVERGMLMEIEYDTTPANSQSPISVRGFKLPLFDHYGNPSHLLCIAEDVTERKKQEEALRLIVEGTASKTGDEFFQTCVRYLAEVLNVRYALIMEFSDVEKTKVKVLADYNRDTKRSPDIEYALEGTPCEYAALGQVCYYPQNVKTLFPHSQGLIKREAESYLGIPLADSLGNVLGHLAVLDVKPMEENPGRELILRIFAARAGAELERKHAENALRDSEERFRTLVNNIPGVVNRGAYDPQWTMEFLSDAMIDMCGYPASDFIHNQVRSFADIIYPDDLPMTHICIGDALAHRQPYVLEYRIIHADGSIRWIYEKGQGIFNAEDELLSLDGVMLDITDRKQAEAALQQEIREREQAMQALRKAEEKFAKAFRASPSPIAITTLPDRRFLEVNRSFLRMSGFTEQEVLGHTANELNLGVAQDAYEEAIQTLLKTGSLYNQEFKFRTKAGEIRTILLSIEMIDLSGTTCALNILNDITERKRLENEFISLVSHELRTPMTSMIGALDLLNTGQVGTFTPQGQKLLDVAISNTERLIRLVNDILDLERMKSGKITMQKTVCNVDDLIHQAIEAMQNMANDAQVSLVTEPISIEIWVDSDRMLQMLINLLSNAIKFSEPGKSVWLTATRQTGSIELPSPDSTGETFQSLLLLTVRDEGRGIPPDKLRSIFEPFQQVDASDSRKKGGTGLGLAICRNIVEQHQGRIWVESVMGQGSTFYILIPIEPQPQQQRMQTTV